MALYFLPKGEKMWKNHEKYSFSAIKAQIMKIHNKVKNEKTSNPYNASFDEKWVMSHEFSQRYSQSKMATKLEKKLLITLKSLDGHSTSFYWLYIYVKYFIGNSPCAYLKDKKTNSKVSILLCSDCLFWMPVSLKDAFSQEEERPWRLCKMCVPSVFKKTS